MIGEFPGPDGRAPDEVIRHFAAPPVARFRIRPRLPRLGVVILCVSKRDRRLELPHLVNKVWLAPSDNFIQECRQFDRTQSTSSLGLWEQPDTTS